MDLRHCLLHRYLPLLEIMEECLQIPGNILSFLG